MKLMFTMNLGSENNEFEFLLEDYDNQDMLDISIQETYEDCAWGNLDTTWY